MKVEITTRSGRLFYKSPEDLLEIQRTTKSFIGLHSAHKNGEVRRFLMIRASELLPRDILISKKKISKQEDEIIGVRLLPESLTTYWKEKGITEIEKTELKCAACKGDLSIIDAILFTGAHFHKWCFLEGIGTLNWEHNTPITMTLPAGALKGLLDLLEDFIVFTKTTDLFEEGGEEKKRRVDQAKFFYHYLAVRLSNLNKDIGVCAQCGKACYRSEMIESRRFKKAYLFIQEATLRYKISRFVDFDETTKDLNITEDKDWYYINLECGHQLRRKKSSGYPTELQYDCGRCGASEVEKEIKIIQKETVHLFCSEKCNKEFWVIYFSSIKKWEMKKLASKTEVAETEIAATATATAATETEIGDKTEAKTEPESKTIEHECIECKNIHAIFQCDDCEEWLGRGVCSQEHAERHVREERLEEEMPEIVDEHGKLKKTVSQSEVFAGLTISSESLIADTLSMLEKRLGKKTEEELLGLKIQISEQSDDFYITENNERFQKKIRISRDQYLNVLDDLLENFVPFDPDLEAEEDLEVEKEDKE